jgi:hypothetical protein
VLYNFEPHDRTVTVHDYIYLSAEVDIIELVCDLPPRLIDRDVMLTFYHTPPLGQAQKLCYTTESTPSRVMYRIWIPHIGIDTVEITAISEA